MLFSIENREIYVTHLENVADVRDEFNQQHDQTVRAEIEAFREKAAAFVAGQISDDDFRPYRLRFGCYGQRQPGVQMMRTKVPGGMLTAEQMERLADVADFVGGGKGCIPQRGNTCSSSLCRSISSPIPCICCMTSG